jgi:hypothetical protein
MRMYFVIGPRQGTYSVFYLILLLILRGHGLGCVGRPTWRTHLHFIQPGNLVQNAFIERFNGTFRDERLNSTGFSRCRKPSSSLRPGGGSTTKSAPQYNWGGDTPAVHCQLSKQGPSDTRMNFLNFGVIKSGRSGIKTGNQRVTINSF